MDLSGVPLPKTTPQQRETYTLLAPLVGVAPLVPDPDNPTLNLLHLAISRHGIQSGLPAHTKQDFQSRFTTTKLFAFDEKRLSGPLDLVLRGWYATKEEPRWCPCQSRFGGRAGRHLGVDLAAPPGVIVRSPLDGVAEFNPVGEDAKRGNHIFIYSESDPPCGILLCHLQDPTGNFPRRVRAGEPIGVLGFSGVSLYGGTMNIFGKYDTHLHLEVVTRDGHQDPLDFFGFSPRYADDGRCFFPANPLRLCVCVPHPILG